MESLISLFRPRLYRYKPIESPRHVRFLAIRPWRESDKFVPWERPQYQDAAHDNLYEIIHKDIDEVEQLFSLSSSSITNMPLRYLAVSYAWGDHNRTKLLKLKTGECIPITSSLHDAIPQFVARAVKFDYRLMWIDQICTDQNNLRELGQQVALMQDLYAAASMVTIWLGGEDRHTRYLTELVQNVSGDVLSREVSGREGRKVTQELQIQKLFTSADTKGQKLTPHQLAFLKVFDRPWFQRAWTFQEAVLGRSVLFVIGEQHIALDCLVNTIEAIGQSRTSALLFRARKKDKSAAAGYEILMAIQSSREQRVRLRNRYDYYHILSEIASVSQTSNLRDLCYAFLGFQNNPNIKVTPQYSLSVREVFISTTRSIIDGSLSLDVFGALNRGLPHIDLALPSWAPNWSSPPAVVPLHVSHSRHIFRASAGYPHKGEVLSGDRLVVWGTAVDIVGSIHRRHDVEYRSSQRPDIHSVDIQDFLRLFDTLNDLRLNSPEEASLFTAGWLLRVMTAEGACPGDNEMILQHEAGFDETRLEELLEAYNSWADVQKNADHFDYYERRLDAEALLAYSQVLVNRCVIRTADGRLGLAPREVQIGDSISIIHGSETPILLRHSSNDTFKVIGQCYVEGIMRGEAIDKVTAKELVLL